MKDYLLFIDVSGDIDRKYVQDGKLKLVPMEFFINNEVEVYTADENGMDLVKFYDEIKKKTIVKTSQITPNKYEEYFRPYLEQGYSCLYLGISKGLSAAYQSSLIASQNLKEEFPDVDFVSIDTDCVTSLLGLLAERMIENKEKGMTIQENAEDLNNVKSRIKGFTFVDDLQALKRGGRIGAATAFIGAMLNIKPIIEMSGGTLHMIGKQKGIKKTISYLVDIFQKNYNPEISNVVYICDACEEAVSNDLEKAIKEVAPDCEIKKTLLTPIVGAHLGSGAMIISFWGN
ncbi:MAG: DegV family protein [Clostridia bacterium]|nr:DegV family protein [Clostridia bacterium]